MVFLKAGMNEPNAKVNKGSKSMSPDAAGLKSLT